MKTKIGIVGAGPAGLVLSRYLSLHGIDNIVVEKSTRQHVEDRLRAGVLEPGSVALFDELGVGKRMHEQGLVHDSIGLLIDGTPHEIKLKEITGNGVTIYGQTEITKDLNEAILKDGGKIIFEAQDVALHDFQDGSPRITFNKDGQDEEIECDFIACCDGHHGVALKTLSPDLVGGTHGGFPGMWLGILANAPPYDVDKVTYGMSPEGFFLFSMRSPELCRYYLQCDLGTDLKEWPDERIWDELDKRKGDKTPPLIRGPILEKSLTPLRNFIVKQMRFSKLFLAGDVAHIVEPTGAKGLNNAVLDAQALAEGFVTFFKSGETLLLDNYSDTSLKRAKGKMSFATNLTELTHNQPNDLAGGIHELQAKEAKAICSSPELSAKLAHNYVGLDY